MESLKEQIKRFLNIDVIYGDGPGFGSGCGFGDGFGYGYGDGDGSGSGYGDGFGYYCGDGVKELNGEAIYIVDDVPTFIDSVHVNYAKGRILQSDWTTKECFIAKVYGRYFAHGETLKQAFNDAMSKSFQDIPEDERIARFKEQYPDNDVKIPARELFDWHNRLTGSCEMGRNNFVRNHGIDVDNDSFTVREFVELTKNDYGGQIIKKILES